MWSVKFISVRWASLRRISRSAGGMAPIPWVRSLSFYGVLCWICDTRRPGFTHKRIRGMPMWCLPVFVNRDWTWRLSDRRKSRSGRCFEITSVARARHRLGTRTRLEAWLIWLRRRKTRALGGSVQKRGIPGGRKSLESAIERERQKHVSVRRSKRRIKHDIYLC